jgi:hypothetical protein
MFFTSGFNPGRASTVDTGHSTGLGRLGLTRPHDGAKVHPVSRCRRHSTAKSKGIQQ